MITMGLRNGLFQVKYATPPIEGKYFCQKTCQEFRFTIKSGIPLQISH